MLIFLTTLLASLASIFRSRASLGLENLALRHQISVLHRSAGKRPKLTSGDRLLWICLSRLWRDWRSALAIVKPETVVAWHRAAFRLFWTWKVRCGKPGRPVISSEVRDLIRKMCRENPGWGAPRIHGELLKLGIDIGESSVSKYMVRCRKPPSQTWWTFFENHAQQLFSIAFFTVPTIRFKVLYGFWCWPITGVAFYTAIFREVKNVLLGENSRTPETAHLCRLRQELPPLQSLQHHQLLFFAHQCRAPPRSPTGAWVESGHHRAESVAGISLFLT